MIPGGAATTAGIALMTGSAVMMCPSTMNSSMVVASKYGGGRMSIFVVIVGRPWISTVHPMPTGQSGSSESPLRHRTRISTTVAPPTLPSQWMVTPATVSLANVHEPRSSSLVVFAYSASHTISSNTTPSASPTRATASLNTIVAAAVMPGSSGSSSGRPNPTGISVGGESYAVVSASSLINTQSMRSDALASAMATSSM